MAVLNTLTAELETARKIFWLLKHDAIFLTGYNDDVQKHDDGSYPAIDCNDLFVPGADDEMLQAEDLDAFIEVVKLWPRVGKYAWCGYKRNDRPWRNPSNKEWLVEYDEAIAGIPDVVMKLKSI